jgi:hypothetical protein
MSSPCALARVRVRRSHGKIGMMTISNKLSAAGRITLHGKLAASLAITSIAERSSVDSNGETLRWEFSFSRLTDGELKGVIEATKASVSGTVQFNVGEDDPGDDRAVGVVDLSDGEAREFVTALTATFQRVK